MRHHVRFNEGNESPLSNPLRRKPFSKPREICFQLHAKHTRGGFVFYPGCREFFPLPSRPYFRHKSAGWFASMRKRDRRDGGNREPRQAEANSKCGFVTKLLFVALSGTRCKGSRRQQKRCALPLTEIRPRNTAENVGNNERNGTTVGSQKLSEFRSLRASRKLLKSNGVERCSRLTRSRVRDCRSLLTFAYTSRAVTIDSFTSLKYVSQLLQ